MKDALQKLRSSVCSVVLLLVVCCMLGLVVEVVGVSIKNPPMPVTWSNRQGVTITPVATGVWAAERPFIWNKIDVGGRSVIVRMQDGSLCVHSPVEWTPELGDLLTQLGDVGYVISPNYEHLKYARQWAAQYPEARMIACPGLPERMPDVDWSDELGSDTPSSLTSSLDSVYFDCEVNPFTGKPFFNEIVFYHKASRTMFMADMFWNYPSKNIPNFAEEMVAEGSYSQHQCSKVSLPTTGGSSSDEIPPVSVPFGTRLWKFGMDRVYAPFFQRAMVGRRGERRDRYNEAVQQVLSWDCEVIAPCHGDIIRGKQTCRKALEQFF